MEQQYKEHLKNLNPANYSGESDVVKIYETMAIEPPEPEAIIPPSPAPASARRPLADVSERQAHILAANEASEPEPASNIAGASGRSSRASTTGQTVSARTATTEGDDEEAVEQVVLQGGSSEEPEDREVERPSTPENKAGTK